MMLRIFSCVCWTFIYLIREMSIQILCPFLNWFIFSSLSFTSSLYIFWRQVSYQIYDEQIFSTISWLSFHLLGFFRSTTVLNLELQINIGTCDFSVIFKKSFPNPWPQRLIASVSFQEFIIFVLTFRSLIHLNFLCMM